MFTASSTNVSWWPVLLPNLISSVVVAGTIVLLNRKRRWRDRRLMAKATTLPAEHREPEPKEVRDMIVGEEAYIDSSAVVTSKGTGRVFVPWDASLRKEPEHPMSIFAPLRVRRLERGFSIAIRPGDQFHSGSLPWGYYAPVTEIVQAIAAEQSQLDASGQ